MFHDGIDFSNFGATLLMTTWKFLKFLLSQFERFSIFFIGGMGSNWLNPLVPGIIQKLNWRPIPKFGDSSADISNTGAALASGHSPVQFT